jgi:hypothetical protein
MALSYAPPVALRNGRRDVNTMNPPPPAEPSLLLYRTQMDWGRDNLTRKTSIALDYTGHNSMNFLLDQRYASFSGFSTGRLRGKFLRNPNKIVGRTTYDGFAKCHNH